jgi:transcriptional regulator with XRE-family HTH domain
MAKRDHPTSPGARDALTVLGAQIAAGRRERRLTAQDLADRAGISSQTLRSAERGTPTVAAGVMFELAILVGVPLFSASSEELRDARTRTEDRLALLPQRVRDSAVNDDF